MNPSGFVHRDGTRILGPAGTPSFHRGMGLGGWLLPEGYMWGWHAPTHAPRAMEAAITRMLGASGADAFWQTYRDRFITEADIALIAGSGFDHVRLPVNARGLLSGSALDPEAVARIDDTLAWCRKAGLTCVLDLHAAPGGQTGANIDDSRRDLPELFTDDAAFADGIQLWSLLAHRYAEDPTVAAYDLLNEPLPEAHGHLVPRLVDFYRAATAAIRAVDRNHLISYEGWNWATRFDLFDEVWDENSCLHFHKYWSETTTASLRPYLEARDRLGLPLWMGESGENDEDWYRAAFGLFEQHEIPWTFWTWKKIEGPTSPVVAAAPAGWDAITRCATGDGDVPADVAQILADMLENLALDRCRVRTELLDLLTTLPSSRDQEPIG